MIDKDTENLPVNVTGVVNIKHFNGDGDLINEIEIPNAVVELGLKYIACRLAGSSSCDNPPSHMALGTSGTANVSSGGVVTSTALGGELASRRQVTSVVDSANFRTVVFSTTFEANTATGAIQEAGIFNNGTTGTVGTPSGVMLARTTFPVINKQATDSLAVTWKITLS